MKTIGKSMLVDSMSFTNRRVLMVFAFIFIIYEATNLGALYVIIPIILAFYPFQNEDKGVSVLNFAAVSKSNVVVGRYLTAIGIFLVCTLIDVVCHYLLSMIMPRTSIGLVGYMLLTTLYVIYVAACLPLYFKFGYAKCIPIMYATAAVIFAIGMLGAVIFKYFNLYWILDMIFSLQVDPLIFGIGGLVIAALITAISLVISLKIYQHRTL
ncbi:ABC-2 transporter permease [Culicoidibacter larvae]|uniref:ABC-2 transporter permease n=1 Tax=Culicoidibacter larvae TaxID=2579976 RepID=A0A5R8QEV8_9FIRM|nr:ABC-2 transporter permease [Culicoidibacter larvae]TLG76545.1 hypothetical protein FEZ08_02710 [Culicoidibacter larvae]